MQARFDPHQPVVDVDAQVLVLLCHINGSYSHLFPSEVNHHLSGLNYIHKEMISASQTTP